MMPKLLAGTVNKCNEDRLQTVNNFILVINANKLELSCAKLSFELATR